jgi:hypothetical protein
VTFGGGGDADLERRGQITKHHRLMSRPQLDDPCMYECAGKLDAEKGIGKASLE